MTETVEEVDVYAAKLEKVQEFFNLLNTKYDYSDFTDDLSGFANDVADKIRNVGTRDGFLKLFSELSIEDMQDALTNISGTLAVLGAATDDEHASNVHYFDLVVAAISYLYVGKETKAGNGDFAGVQGVFKFVTSLVESIENSGEQISLNKLLARAIGGGVPNYVFFESIEAVPMNEILDTIKE